MFFLRRLTEVSSVTGLTTREHEKLVLRLTAIRNRVWWIGGIGSVCTLLLWLLAALKLPSQSPWYASATGLLVGITLSYLILVPYWFNESQAFIDKVRLETETAKRRADALKDLKG